MAKKSNGNGGYYNGLPGWFGWVVLVVGLWFLLHDLNVLPTWGINWWSAALTLFGLKFVLKHW